jgi:hypothetical protein
MRVRSIAFYFRQQEPTWPVSGIHPNPESRLTCDLGHLSSPRGEDNYLAGVRVGLGVNSANSVSLFRFRKKTKLVNSGDRKT